MPEQTTPKKTNEISLPKVLREELNHIKNRTPSSDSTVGDQSPATLENVFKDFHEAKLSALCFSGGGIRSATFGLGIVQVLAKHGLLDKFDYLSTVSGGGYLGSWLSAWIRREQINEFETPLIVKRLDKLQSLEKKILVRLKKENDKLKKGSINSVEIQKLERRIQKLKKLQEKIADLLKAAEVKLFEIYQKFQTCGISKVQTKLNEHSIPKADETCPNIEPKQLQYLREYSNYMSPKVGLLSADTWTLVAIYTRNLFLNWTIFIPLICAVLLIPRILLALVKERVDETGLSLMLLFSLFVGIVAVFFTASKLPNKNLYISKKKQKIDLNSAGKESRIPNWAKINRNNDVGVFLTVIFPMILMAFAATTFWAWYHRSGAIPFSSFPSLRAFFQYETINFIIFSAAIFVVGNLSLYVFKRLFYANAEFRGWEFVSALVSSSIGGIVTWLISYNFFDTAYFADSLIHPFHLPIYICLAVPLYLLSFSIASAIFTGIYSRVASDEDREWLARQGAWIMIACVAWLALNGLVFFGPIALEYIFGIVPNGQIAGLNFTDSRWLDFLRLVVSVTAGVSGFISLVGGFSGKTTGKNESGKSTLSKILAVAPKIAAVVFLAFIFVGLAYLSSLSIPLVSEFLNRHFFNQPADWLTFKDVSTHLKIIEQSSIGFLLICLAVLSAIGLTMACFINVNKFSLHGAYRDRLIRAYLGASHTNRRADTYTGFDDADNFQLHRLKGQKPFHVINATLNLADGKNLAWQDRKAASFTMSPLYCGSWLLGYRKSNEYSRNPHLQNCLHLRYCNQNETPCPGIESCKLQGKALRLGTAMAISGAAANPNMGYYSSPVVMFLMSLFNIRLGWWLGNTGAIGDHLDFWKHKVYTKTSPSIAVLPLLNETLGRTDENKRFLNVTDGGHFENLGLYEMILRRCQTIVLSDAAADDNFTFGEIANAIEKCKVDLGVNIKFNDDIHIYSRHQQLDDETPKSRYAIAEIIYPEKNDNGEHHTGKLLYIRPSFYEKIETTELRNYARSNATFPHQSTADQLYDEKQFEAYRSLGFCIMEEILKRKSATILLKTLTDKIVVQKLSDQPDFTKPLSDLSSFESSDAV